MRKTAGIAISLLSVLFWFIETASGHLLSDQIGESLCKEDYLQPVNGFVGDLSCGFNSDMYMSSILILLFLLGMLLLLTERRMISELDEADEEKEGHR